MKKVKKFGRGGDIITGLGAVLVGKALYDKYKEGKGSDKDDYASKVKEYNAKNKPAEDNKPEEAVSIAKKEPSAGEKRAMAASKGQPEMGDIDVAESDKALVRTAPKGSKPASKPVAKDVKVKPATQSTVEGSTPKDKSGYAPASRNVRSMIEGKGMSGPKGTQDVGKALGISSNAKGTQTLGERIQSTFENAGKSVVRTPQQRMADAAREVEARRKREAGGMKKGGAIKASKMGSVKTAKPTMRSASSRADGIAIRGKTRA